MYGYWPGTEQDVDEAPRSTPAEIKQMYKDLAAVLCRIEKAGERLDLYHDTNQMRIAGQTAEVGRSPSAPGYWSTQ